MMTLTHDDLAKLNEPFHPASHEFLQGNAYIREDAITHRLESVDPAWSFQVIEIVTRANADKPTVTVLGRMTVKNVVRENTGMASVVMSKSGKGEANEAEKSATTDALKRCARLFGIGRYLLSLPKDVCDEKSLAKFLGNEPPTPPPGKKVIDMPQQRQQKPDKKQGDNPADVWPSPNNDDVERFIDAFNKALFLSQDEIVEALQASANEPINIISDWRSTGKDKWKAAAAVVAWAHGYDANLAKEWLATDKGKPFADTLSIVEKVCELAEIEHQYIAGLWDDVGDLFNHLQHLHNWYSKHKTGVRVGPANTRNRDVIVSKIRELKQAQQAQEAKTQ